jgi:hypothetical protein
MLKTKIAVWLVIGISLLEMYALGKNIYHTFQYMQFLPKNLSTSQLTKTYLSDFVTYVIPLVLSIFILLRKKWAWWGLIVYLYAIVLSALLYIVAISTNFSHFLLPIAIQVGNLLLVHHALLIYHGDYYSLLLSIFVLVLLFLDRKNFF